MLQGLQSALAAPARSLPGAAPSRRVPPAVAAAHGLPGLSSGLYSREQSPQLRSDFLPSFGARARVPRRRACSGGAVGARAFASDAGQLQLAKGEIKKLLAEKKPHGILIRLAWHDSGSYDSRIEEWPKRGGANGSIRFAVELGHNANAGLGNGLALLEPIKKNFPGVSYADLFQLASATAIEDAGGPKIPMRYGRVDTVTDTECAIEGNLPEGDPPEPSDHLRKVFHRMDFSDQEIVALSGAHTMGRSRPDRSGFGKPETKYTTRDNMGAKGGQSWTVEWLTFDNSYFKDIKAQSDEDLLVLVTDKILTEDPEFKKYTNKYAEDQDAFFKDYAQAHAKLSERGSKFDPPEGFKLDEAPVPEKFSAAKFSSGSDQRELSDTMKEKIRAEYLGLGGSPDKPLKSNYFLNIMLVVAVLAIISSIITQN